MRLLGTYLWKEWRDHRAVLVGMVVAVPALLVVMGFSLPRTALDVASQRAGFAALASFACFVLFVVSLAADLVPGEARRGHRWFLERLPGGLGAAFRGKLVLFVAGAAFFATYGYLAAALSCRIVAGDWPSLLSPTTVTWILADIALWVFAVSCALPRGALSLPAAGALALLLALPVLVCWQFDPWGRPKHWWDGAPLLALWGFGAIVAARVAFRRPGFLGAGRACLVVGAVCALPYWADAAHDAYLIGVNSRPVIMGGFVGEGGRYAFLNRGRRDTVDRSGWSERIDFPPVIVDLETGAVREMPYVSSWDSILYFESCPQRYVTLLRWTRSNGAYSTGLDRQVFDARTAEPAQPTPDDLNAAQRATTPRRLPDGRRVWSTGGRLEAGAQDGPGAVLADKWGWGQECGLGFSHGKFLYDPWRQRVYDRGSFGLKGYYGLWIRPGRWLVKKNDSPELFDPDTRTLSLAIGLKKMVSPMMLDDGRVFGRDGERVILVDPETGATAEPNLPPGFHIMDPMGSIRRTPDGRRVFVLWDGKSRGAFARYDPESGTFATTAITDGYPTLRGCATDDTAIVTNLDALLRLRFGSEEREEIWRVR
ncbi:MAG: hypothetical protein ACHQ1G_00795 [Planctomycetota bacterium]